MSGPHEWSSTQGLGQELLLWYLSWEISQLAAVLQRDWYQSRRQPKMVERNENKLYPIVLACHPSPNFYPKIVLAKVKYIYIAFGYIFLF